MSRRNILSERTVRVALYSLAAINLGLAISLFFFPHSFYTTLGAFGPYSRHYERDVATFYLAFALGALVAAKRPSWRGPVIAMTAVQYGTHAINHAVDVNNAHNSWAGPFDLASIAITALLAGLLWVLLRREGTV